MSILLAERATRRFRVDRPKKMTNRKRRVALCMGRRLDLDAFGCLIELLTNCRVAVRVDSPNYVIRKAVSSRTRLIVMDSKFVAEIDWPEMIKQLERHELRAILVGVDNVNSAVAQDSDAVRLVTTTQDLIHALGACHNFELDEATELLNAVPPSLTAREREVWVTIAMGYSVAEVADELGLAESTVDSHKSKLMKKLNVRKSVDLARLAIRLGLVEV